MASGPAQQHSGLYLEVHAAEWTLLHMPKIFKCSHKSAGF